MRDARLGEWGNELTCIVCGSEHVFRRERCDRDYRWWLKHGTDRVLTPEEREVRTDRQNVRRAELERQREALLAAGG